MIRAFFRKKTTPFILCICILTGLFGVLPGCARAQNAESANEPDQAIEEAEVSDDTEVKTEAISSEPISFGGIANAVDDNYRNYYEIFVHSFYDTDGDGVGDLKGVTEKLDYVADLGCNGIWLMPIMPSPTYHKYDVINYKDVDPEYGTLDDFKELTKTAHEKGIRVIIDFVINHSSSKHTWFKQACDYLKTLGENDAPDESVCPYVGYYHFSKEKVNATWYPVSGSDYFYEGQFWSEMPDLNLSNQALRQELMDTADLWIDAGVDGFRMDAPLHFEEGDAEYNCEVLSWLYQYCKGKNPDFYMVSEVWDSKGTIASYYELSKTPSFFNFPASQTEGSIISTVMGNMPADKFMSVMVGYQEDYGAGNPDFIDAPFITNHDQGRPCNIFQSDPDAMKFAGGLLSIMSGNPFIYYGEEVGMKSKGSKDENKRLAMNWSATDKEGTPKDPKNADKGIEQSFPGVKEQECDPDSILTYYKRALYMRNSFPEIARGEGTVLPPSSGMQAIMSKEYEGSKIYIAINTAKKSKDFDISSLGGLEVAYSLTLHGEEIPYENGVLKMPERSICILK